MLRATGAAVYAGPRLLGTSRQTSDLPAGRGGVHWWGRLFGRQRANLSLVRGTMAARRALLNAIVAMALALVVVPAVGRRGQAWIGRLGSGIGSKYSQQTTPGCWRMPRR
jgi:hypothetical protein